MKKFLVNILKVIIVFYLLICAGLYFFQEKLIFFPQKLSPDYQFDFKQDYEELFFKTKDGTSLNGILFKADSSKGLIFYLHGNAGSLMNWGGIAKTYTDLHYDLFMPDCRGYGKSEGNINSEKQLFDDNQFLYDNLKLKYNEDSIIVLGYSIGTGPASKLASTNAPRLLILQAPYYSLTDMMQHTYKVVPAFLLKYKFETNEFIKACNMPVVIFHGNKDEVIYYESSLKLKKLFKASDTLIILDGQAHNGMSNNPEYINALRIVLRK